MSNCIDLLNKLKKKHKEIAKKINTNKKCYFKISQRSQKNI